MLERYERPDHRTSKNFKIHPELKSLRPFVWTDHEQRTASMEFVMIPHKECDTLNVEIEVLCAEEPDLAHFRLS